MIMPKITLDLAPALVLGPVHVLEEVDRYIQFNFYLYSFDYTLTLHAIFYQYTFLDVSPLLPPFSETKGTTQES